MGDRENEVCFLSWWKPTSPGEWWCREVSDVLLSGRSWRKPCENVLCEKNVTQLFWVCATVSAALAQWGKKQFPQSTFAAVILEYWWCDLEDSWPDASFLVLFTPWNLIYKSHFSLKSLPVMSLEWLKEVEGELPGPNTTVPSSLWNLSFLSMCYYCQNYIKGVQIEILNLKNERMWYYVKCGIFSYTSIRRLCTHCLCTLLPSCCLLESH